MYYNFPKNAELWDFKEKHEGTKVKKTAGNMRKYEET